MSVKISATTQEQLSSVLNYMEGTSELIKCMVVTRTGIKIAPDMDADTYSASSAALIDLGERVVSSLDHGSLQELVINALGGYVILVAVGKEYMLLGATSAALKMGYYLPYIREKAWEMESIIYGGDAAALKDLISPATEAPQPEEVTTPKVRGDVIKEADMKAMNDVLAAFEEFGIDDDFSQSLSGGAVPTVGISKDEMDTINLQLHGSDVPPPEVTTSMSSPVMGPEISGIAATGEPHRLPAADRTGVCPIQLEPMEVPPYPLDPAELNPFDATQEPTEIADPVALVTPQAGEPMVSGPASGPVVAPPAVSEQAPRAEAPAPLATFPATPSQPAAPSFEDASEYDFDFGSEVKKDVVISEKDSMSDALKALGWEEEDDS